MKIDESTTDADLLAAWTAAGDREALALVAHRYAPMVLGVCRRHCKTASDADDAFQVTFMILARSAGSIRFPAALPGWLHSTAYRVAARSRRRLGTAEDVRIDDVPDPREPLDQISRCHELQLLDEELARMPEPLRAAIVMHYLDGLRISQVADRLETTLGTVRGRLQRGRRELRQRLILRGVSLGSALAALGIMPSHTAAAAELADAFLHSTAADATATPATEPREMAHLQALLSSSTSSSASLVMKMSLVIVASLIVTLLLPWGQGEAQPPTESTGSRTGGGGAVVKLAGVPAPPAEAAFAAPVAPPAAASDEPEAPDAADPAPASKDPFGGSATPFGRNAGGEDPFGGSADPLVKDASSGNPFGGSVGGDPFGGSAGGDPFARRAEIPSGPQGAKQVRRSTGSDDTGRGIGTNRYVNIDDRYVRELDEKLTQPYSKNFNQIPLEDAVRIIAQEMDIQFVLDTRALEEVGLTRDLPVTLALSDVSLDGFFQGMLSPADLTLRPMDGFVMITTKENAEKSSHLLSRAYWLDVNGLTADAATEAIQTMVEPDTWKTLGGPSTIVTLPANEHGRTTLLVAAPFQVHREIEKLLTTIRQGASDPDAAPLEPKSTGRTAPLEATAPAGGEDAAG